MDINRTFGESGLQLCIQHLIWLLEAGKSDAALKALRELMELITEEDNEK